MNRSHALLRVNWAALTLGRHGLENGVAGVREARFELRLPLLVTFTSTLKAREGLKLPEQKP